MPVFEDIGNILKTYSVVNDFMLRPPASTYSADTFDSYDMSHAYAGRRTSGPSSPTGAGTVGANLPSGVNFRGATSPPPGGAKPAQGDRERAEEQQDVLAVQRIAQSCAETEGQIEVLARDAAEANRIRSSSASVSLHMVYIPRMEVVDKPADLSSSSGRSSSSNAPAAATTAATGAAVTTSTTTVRELPPNSLNPPVPCLYICHRTSPYLMLFFHGNACDIGYPSSSMLELYALTLRCSVLAVEYPGYGLLPGKYCEAGNKASAENVIHYLVGKRANGSTGPQIPLPQLLLMGQSIGSGATFHALDVIMRYYDRNQDPTSPTTHAGTFLDIASAHDPASVGLAGASTAYHTGHLGGIIIKSGFTSVKNVITSNLEYRTKAHAREGAPLVEGSGSSLALTAGGGAASSGGAGSGSGSGIGSRKNSDLGLEGHPSNSSIPTPPKDKDGPVVISPGGDDVSLIRSGTQPHQTSAVRRREGRNESATTPDPHATSTIPNSASNGSLPPVPHGLDFEEPVYIPVLEELPSEPPLLFRFGQKVIMDRFRNTDVIQKYQPYFSNGSIPLLLVHGMADEVISHLHSIINYHAARGDPVHRWCDIPQQCIVAKKAQHASAAAGRSGPQLALYPGVGHNNIVALPELMAFFKRLPCNAPAADGGPPLTAAPIPRMLFPAGAPIAKDRAVASLLASRRLSANLSLLGHSITLSWAALILTVCVFLHPSLCSGDDRIAAVPVWGSIESVFLSCIVWLSWNSNKYGLASENPRGTYFLARIISYTAIGVVSMILGPYWLSSIDWSVGSLSSQSGSPSICRTMPAMLMRLTVAAHYVHLLWTVIRNK